MAIQKVLYRPRRISIVEEVLELVAHLLADAAGDGVGVAVAVDHVGHAARHEHRAQRGDEGRELELAHEHAVEHAYQQAGHQRDQDGGDGCMPPDISVPEIMALIPTTEPMDRSMLPVMSR